MSESEKLKHPPGLVRLEVDHPIWDRFFTVAPLVVIGSREVDGQYVQTLSTLSAESIDGRFLTDSSLFFQKSKDSTP